MPQEPRTKKKGRKKEFGRRVTLNLDDETMGNLEAFMEDCGAKYYSEALRILLRHALPTKHDAVKP